MTADLLWHAPTASAGAAQDLEWAMDVLGDYRAASAEDQVLPELVRVYLPEPSLAFGQRDARLPGYETAAAAAREHGFEPLVRRAGGRAAAYHHGCLVVDHLSLEPEGALRQQARFQEFAELFVRAFARVGVTAGIGEIPGEYCPGEHTVHGEAGPAAVGAGRGPRIKLAGSAQRVVKGAWLFSTHVVVADAAPLQAVLADVYRALGLPMDARTVGAADDAVPGLAVEAFTAGLRAEYEAWAAGRGSRVRDVAAARISALRAP